MRAVVCAYSEVGVVCLTALLELGADVAAVLTHADDPEERQWFRSVAALAHDRGLPVFSDERLDTPAWLARLRGWNADYLFSFYYRRLLPQAVLDTARRGALNLHGSLLPRYRGRCPTNWVLINGERETGVTLHHMVVRPDAGDIVAQRRVPIDDADTALTLQRKQAAAADALLREIYPYLCDGTAPRTPMELTAGNYCGGRRPADGAIDWAWEAVRVINMVRAVTHPYPGAFSQWRGRRLMIWTAQTAPARGAAAPGTVLAVAGDAVLVQAGADAVRLLRVQWADEAERPAGEWARAHGVRVGTVLA